MVQTKLNDMDDKSDNSGKDTIAQRLAAGQREIGVAEFFAKNRHLLGFDNKRKALMTTIKEAVDNALDACEEARVLPEIIIEVIDMGNDRFRIMVEDNGPGIVKKQIPNIFAKLLYGSKFHKLKQSRGQQGIGISASVMYGQLTTGRAARIVSKIHPKEPAHYYELKLDTQKNKPEILKEEKKEWNKDRGTKVEIDLEGSYQKGGQSIDEYLKQTAIVNPHATIIYTNPKAEQIIFPRATDNLPDEPKEIQPHPYGVELGVMQMMLRTTESRTLQAFLSTEFTRVGSGTAKTICEHARLLPNTKPKDMSREMVEQLMEGIKKTKLINPPTDCVSPIGAEALEKGLRKEINAEFYVASTRPPSVYRGNPFVIEVGIAYGGEQSADGPVRLLRFANRVPLLFQQGACVSTKSTVETNWRPYGLSQSQKSLPIGPCTIAVHIASVWVPFTSESKEAIAHYPEIVKEMKLAMQECGRKLASYVKKKRRIKEEGKKRSYIETFIPHVAEALKEILKLSKADVLKTNEMLTKLLEQKRGKLEDLSFDPSKNVDYDEELAKIGKEDGEEVESETETEEQEVKKKPKSNKTAKKSKKK
ncbi:DNA topoisomerase VI subunit B [Candidatus Woesearchaeota archaeon]|nr:DNA topoisomerase VI subunit B [Candidatus Woesearchaeota archaeon]